MNIPYFAYLFQLMDMDCFQFSVVMNYSLLNLIVCLSVDICLYFSYVKNKIGRNLIVNICLTLKEATELFLKWLYHFLFPWYEGSNFSTSSPKFAICLLNYDHSSEGIVASHFYFICF